MATIWGRPLNLCREPEQLCLYGTYISDVTGDLYQIARTYYLSPHLHNHCKNEIRSTRGQFICVMWSIWTMVNITHNRYKPMQYTSQWIG